LLSYVELTPFLLTVLTDCDASSLVIVFPPEVVPVFVKVTAGVVFEVGVERRTLVDGTMVDEGDGEAACVEVPLEAKLNRALEAPVEAADAPEDAPETGLR